MATMQVPMWQVQQHWVTMGLVQCCAYLASILVVLVSSLVLLCLVIQFWPHMRTLFYQEGTCMVVKSLYTIQYSCECSQDNCHAFYPCMLLYVLINTSSAQLLDADTREQLRWPVPAFDDDWQQIHVYESQEDSVERCSKYVCDGGTHFNRDVIERYRLSMAGRQHQCWFDPSNLLHKGAVFRRHISWTLSFHVLFWPVLFILVGFTLMLILCCLGRRRRASSSLSDGGSGMSSSETIIVQLEKF